MHIFIFKSVKTIRNNKLGICEADHIPPIQVFTKVWKDSYKECMTNEFLNKISEKMTRENQFLENLISLQTEKERIKRLVNEKFESIWKEAEKMINDNCEDGKDEEITSKLMKKTTLEKENITSMITALQKMKEYKELVDGILALDAKIFENMSNNENINPEDIVSKIKAIEKIISKMRVMEEMKRNKKGLFDLIDEKGEKGLCKNVLTLDHRKGLTLGKSTYATSIR